MHSIRLAVFSCVITFTGSVAGAFESSPPEAQGVSARGVLEWVRYVDHEQLGLHSFVLVRHGKLVAEGWWAPYAPERPHVLYSLSKSFTSTAIGLAVDEGKLLLDNRVASFFPDKLPEHSGENLLRMRVRDLLCMGTGGKDTIGAMKRTKDSDWIKAFLSLPVEHEPGTFFCYNTGATYMLAAILKQATGEDLLDYLNARLFTPLDIADATWSLSPQGIRTGGFGLKLKTRDIAAFGQLYLQRGCWNGKRILPEYWVAQATTRQIRNGTNPTSDWNQGYGFQFWRCRHDCFRGDGAFGQLCIVMPGQDAVLAVTAGLNDMQNELNSVWKYLLPAFSPAPLPPDAAADAELKKTAASLAFAPLPVGTCEPSSVAAGCLGKTFPLQKNEAGLEAIALLPTDGHLCLLIKNSHGEQKLEIGMGRWSQGSLNLTPSPYEVLDFPPGIQPAAASGAWIKPEVYLLRVIFNETPYTVDVTFHFQKDALDVDVKFNVCFSKRTYTFHSDARSKH